MRFCPEDDLAFSRVRLWPLHLTFWTFLWQVAQSGASCRDAVREAGALCASQDQPVPADETGPYCTARAKLPVDRLESIHSDLVKDAQARILQRDLWCGHRVSVVDRCDSVPDRRIGRTYPLGRGEFGPVG